MAGTVKRTKTWKREVGGVMLGFLGFEVFQGDVAMVEAIVNPIMLYLGGVFIGHEYSSNIAGRGPSVGMQRK